MVPIHLPCACSIDRAAIGRGTSCERCKEQSSDRYLLRVSCRLSSVGRGTQRNGGKQNIGSGAITLVGRVSYGIYLIHVVVLNFAKKITQEPPLLFLLTTVLSICLASLLSSSLKVR